MKTLFFILFVFLSASISYGENLSAYRKLEIKSSETLSKDVVGIENKAKEKVQALRALNGQFRDIDLKDENQKPISYPSEMVRPLRKFSSSFLRSALSQAGQTLKEKEQHGQPRLFDPSLQINEIQEANWESKRKVFDEEIIQKKINNISIYNHLINQIYVEAKIAQLDQSVAQGPSLTTPFEAQISKSLQNHIKDYQPKAEDLKKPATFKKIEDVVGALDHVEIYDGYVTRLHFARNENGNTVLTPVNLGMLANIRSGEDEYFVIMLGLISEHIDNEVDSFYKVDEKEGGFKKDKTGNRIRKSISKTESERLDRLELVQPYITKKFNEAVAANHLLLGLDPVQLSFLIDMMLQLRRQDIPAEGELNILKEQLSMEMTAIENKNEVIESEAEKTKTEPKLVTRIEKYDLDLKQVERDLAFYDDLKRQLYKLQYQLEFERGEK
jgi:hypothetical protein